MAIANSRHCLVDENGLDLTAWPEELAQAPAQTLAEFTQLIIGRNLRNSIFVDVTANPAAAGIYADLLVRSVAIVACNKVAASSDYAQYARLKSLSKEFNASYLYETNEGAAPLIIGTLNDLTCSGDVVRRLEAVLSGTLNFFRVTAFA